MILQWKPPITTRTGVKIGGAYIPPPAQMSDDAERIQGWLVARDGRTRLPKGWRIALLGVVTITALLWIAAMILVSMKGVV